MDVNELELAYQQLHERLLRGELSEEDFKAEVDQLRFTDELDTQWKIGWYTGKWYRYEDGQWVQDKPPDKLEPAVPPPVAGTVPPSEEDGQRRSRTPYLVAALILLLLLASATLVYGWQAGWWGEPAGEATVMAEITPAATDDGSAPETPAPSTPTRAAEAPPEATSTVTSPTRVSSAGSKPSPTPPPSATRARPTATAKAMTATPRATATSARGTATAAATQTATAEPTRTSRPTLTATPSPTTAVSPTARPPTAVPSLSGRIYFPVYDPNPDRRTFDIHVVELDSQERGVAVGQASQPALTTDGKRLAYRSWDSSQRGIWVLDFPNGNTWRWVAFHEAAHANWAPDGQNIVFASQQEVDRRWRIYRTWGLESDRVRRDGGDIFGRVPVWEADGRIYYWECPIDKCGLYAIHGDGTNLTRLTGRERDTAPAVSPDGNQLAYMSNINGNWEIYLTTTRPPAGGALPEPKRLTQNLARDGLPVWSPDGRWLAFVSDRGGAWAVWATRPDGSGQKKLFDLGGPLEGEVANVPPEEQHGWTWETLAWGP